MAKVLENKKNLLESSIKNKALENMREMLRKIQELKHPTYGCSRENRKFAIEGHEFPDK